MIADENYLRECIQNPTLRIPKGYKPIMPTFQGIVSDEQLNALVAYIKSLGQSQTKQAAGSSVAAASQQPPTTQVH